jgi:glycosyltransferase involved in cell wall biosynthesis
MLSILIPEYNYDCTKLVSDLASQCRKESIDFEIIVMDDASSHYLDENRNLSQISDCQFVESSQNNGRAKTLNLLGKRAKYPYLLMLDCDLEVRDDQFIRRYLEALGKAPILVGSVVYQIQKPSTDRLLRWHYGRCRESVSTDVRNRNPFKSLTTPNFLMEKGVFEKVHFDESFQSYGHEDSVMGFSFMQQGFSILYIENPLIHNGLDLNEVFLSKSLMAVEKFKTFPILQTDALVKRIRIFRMYRLIRQWKLDGLIAFKFRILEKYLRKNLLGPHPSMLIFDFYRLGHLCRFVRKTEHQSSRT